MSFKNGFIQFPAFGYSLGLCALIASSQTLERGLMYSLSFLISFVVLSAISPILKITIPQRLVPYAIASVSLIPVMACFFLMGMYDRDARNAISIWLLLISMDPFLRGQIEVLVFSDDISRSFLSASGRILSYVVTFILFASIREFASSGSLSIRSGIDAVIFKPLIHEGLTLGFLALVPGAFILIGYAQALFAFVSGRKGNRAS